MTTKKDEMGVTCPHCREEISVTVITRVKHGLKKVENTLTIRK